MKSKINHRLWTLASLGMVLVLFLGACSPVSPATQPPATEEVEQAPVATEEAAPPTEAEPPTEPAQTEAPAVEPVTLSFVCEYSGYPEEAFRNTVAEFEAQYPDIKIDAWYGPWGGDESYIKTQIAGGVIPDVFGNVFPMPSTVAEWYEEGVVTELTPFLEKPAFFQAEGEKWSDVFSAAALGQYTIDGKMLALPYYSGGTGILWYNKTIFDQYGLTPPATWDEFRQVAVVLKENGIYPVSMQGMPYTMNHWFRTLAQRIAGLEKINATAGRVPGNSWTDPEFMEAGKLVQEIIDNEWIEPGFLGTSYVEGMIPFVTGIAGTMLMSESLIVEAGDAVDEQYEFDFVRWPTVEGGKGDPTGIGLSVDGWAISGKLTEEKLDAAVKFLQFFLSPEQAQKQADIHHYIIAIKGANTSENSDVYTLKYASEILPTSLESWSWWPAPTFGPNDEWVDRWGQITVEWFNGTIGYEEFLKQTEDLANEFAGQ